MKTTIFPLVALAFSLVPCADAAELPLESASDMEELPLDRAGNMDEKPLERASNLNELPLLRISEMDDLMREEESIDDIEEMPMDRTYEELMRGYSRDIDMFALDRSHPYSEGWVTCGKSTTVPINNHETRAIPVHCGYPLEFRTTKKTRRCVATYEVGGHDCPEIRINCPYFNVPNKRQEHTGKCRDNNFLRVKSFNATKDVFLPTTYCEDDKPSYQFPAVSEHKLKVWYEQDPPTQETKNQGVVCNIACFGCPM